MPTRRSPKLPEFEIADITPELAEEWLRKNTLNRKVSHVSVDYYAQAMTDGDWRLNGEPIIFDWNGRLQSGQHRLLAVIKSGVTIQSVVIRNADPADLISLDSGRKRKISDVLSFQGEKNATKLGATISWCYKWEHNELDRLSAPASTTQLLKFYAANPDIKEHVYSGEKLRNANGTSSALGGALHWGFNKIDEKDCDEFFNQLITLENLVPGSPALALNRWCKRSFNVPGRRPSTSYTAAIYIRSWNAFRERRPIDRLYIRASEEFPRPI